MLLSRPGLVLVCLVVIQNGLSPLQAASAAPAYTLSQLENCVIFHDPTSDQVLYRVPVAREPIGAVPTLDRKHLLVANHLPVGRADVPYVAAVLSLVDLDEGEVARELHLPNGSSSVKCIVASPDGRYAVVTHLVARFQKPTVHLVTDWINANALTLVDLQKVEVVGSVLLDDRGKGAANPWGAAFSQDGQTLVVAHAGTHEVSVIDFPRLVERILEFPAPMPPRAATGSASSREEALELAGYVPFFPAQRYRVKLPKGDLGPREVAVVGKSAFVTNYFSGNVTEIDLTATPPLARSLGPPKPGSETLARKGEFYFHTATICFQQWQSCSSCHPGEARVDGLNWDLLNDGTGNPKNTKSLLLAHRTPPAMSLGVRDTAEKAVRAGLHHILFTEPKEEIATAIDEYLKSLKPVPSPHLVNGRLSPLAERGREVFTRAGCAQCHPQGLFTDLQSYDVGTAAKTDKPTDRFDTPSLVELWRTAPYLHDGSAATVREVITVRNPGDQHGRTSHLSPSEIDALCAYLLSL